MLPQDMPAFVRQGGDSIASASNEPDVFKDPAAVPGLTIAENPEHYFALERFAAAQLPPNRYAFLLLFPELHLKEPREIGLLPYAVSDWTDRLTMCFAEYRRNPNDEPVRQRCLAYAGILGHYTADLCQPLHTTIHGQSRNELLKKGTIHAKMDALIQIVRIDWKAVAAQSHPQPFEEVLPATLAEIRRSNALVDKVYGMEKKLTAADDPEVIALGADRLRAAATFTASLYWTAWKKSALVKLPSFL